MLGTVMFCLMIECKMTSGVLIIATEFKRKAGPIVILTRRFHNHPTFSSFPILEIPSYSLWPSQYFYVVAHYE